MVDINGL